MAKKQLVQAQGQIKELQEKLQKHEEDLREKEKSLENERKALEQAQAEKTNIETRAQELRQNNETLEKELATSKNSVQSLQKDVETGGSQRKKIEEELSRVKQDVKIHQEKAAALEVEVNRRGEKVSSLGADKERVLKDLRDEKSALETKVKELEHTSTLLVEAKQTIAKKIEKAAQPLIDIEIAGCEFAKAFPYFLTVQLGVLEKRRTDISAPSDRPAFAKSSFLLPDEGSPDPQVHIGAFCVVNTSGEGEGSARELGTATINVDGDNVSRNINFVRKSGDKMLTVGRATVRISRRPMGDDTITPPIATVAETPREVGLDKSLWMAHPFQCRLRVMLHQASSVPATFGKSVTNVIVRLLRFDGTISYENCSLDVPLNASEPLTIINFNHEVVLPIKMPNLKEQRAQIVLQCCAPGSSVAEILHLSFFLSALPLLHPVHVSAEPSPGRSSSHARPLPSLAMSLTLEPMHHHLGSTKHGVEVRIDGVPVTRPLPEPACDALVAVCPNFNSASSSPKIPVCSYNYDTKQDFTTFLEQHIEDLRQSNSMQPYFITPVVDHARTPNWNQFVVRFAMEPEQLQSISFFLFDKSPGRHDPEQAISDVLVGFTTVDLSTLLPGKEFLQRSFLLDLRLLETPTASSSLEVDCRVWPLETESACSPQRNVGFSTKMPAPRTVDAAASTIGDDTAQPATLSSAINSVNLRNSSAEFQLNHDLSVQLMKEFNLRAAALKTAGQEIVELRRQVQLLTNENNKLKMRIEDEERLAEHVKRNPPKDIGMFDSLSSAELSLRLQTALQKYRDEKAKSQEMTQRLEAALKEVARGRGLQKHLDQLEKTHLEMAAQLQKLQQENQKIELYRKTAKSQEKVIAKLERVLEGSLAEVNKAQEVQIELERLKTENVRMREKCASLMARRKYEGGENIQDLQDEVRKKEQEVKRLQELVDELHSHGGPSGSSSQKLELLEGEKLDWKQRCSAMESRVQSLENQLLENSRQYGRELSTLKLQIAKKDAQVLELQIRLGEDPMEAEFRR